MNVRYSCLKRETKQAIGRVWGRDWRGGAVGGVCGGGAAHRNVIKGY